MDKRAIKWWMYGDEGKKVQVSLYDSPKPVVLSVEEFRARYESHTALNTRSRDDHDDGLHSMYLRNK